MGSGHLNGTSGGNGTAVSIADGGKPDRYKWVALSNTTLSMTMATIDASIVIIAMPAIFRGIGLDPLGKGNSFFLLWMMLRDRIARKSCRTVIAWKRCREGLSQRGCRRGQRWRLPDTPVFSNQIEQVMIVNVLDFVGQNYKLPVNLIQFAAVERVPKLFASQA